MTSRFKTIGIIGKNDTYNRSTLRRVLRFLAAHNINTILDENTALALPNKLKSTVLPLNQLGQYCELIIVIGGDGHFLSAARAVVNFKIPIVGINRGRLGFLTDISPDVLEEKLIQVLNGEYTEEQRFLLHWEVLSEDEIHAQGLVLNDVVLLPGAIAQMIEFEVYIDQQFVCYHRADGMIVATPTGSTAYALSGGGPILYPCLNAIVLVPMFPHTLSSRPIVVHSNSVVELLIPEHHKVLPCVSFDGQTRQPVPAGGIIKISQYATPINIVHPPGYDFYETLRSKLGWLSKKPRNKIK